MVQWAPVLIELHFVTIQGYKADYMSYTQVLLMVLKEGVCVPSRCRMFLEQLPVPLQFFHLSLLKLRPLSLRPGARRLKLRLLFPETGNGIRGEAVLHHQQ